MAATVVAFSPKRKLLPENPGGWHDDDRPWQNPVLHTANRGATPWPLPARHCHRAHSPKAGAHLQHPNRFLPAYISSDVLNSPLILTIVVACGRNVGRG